MEVGMHETTTGVIFEKGLTILRKNFPKRDKTISEKKNLKGLTISGKF
jgi:hypothetical protein